MGGNYQSIGMGATQGRVTVSVEGNLAQIGTRGSAAASVQIQWPTTPVPTVVIGGEGGEVIGGEGGEAIGAQ